METKKHMVLRSQNGEIIDFEETYESGIVAIHTPSCYVTEDGRYFPRNFCLTDSKNTFDVGEKIWCRSRFVKIFN